MPRQSPLRNDPMIGVDVKREPLFSSSAMCGPFRARHRVGKTATALGRGLAQVLFPHSMTVMVTASRSKVRKCPIFAGIDAYVLRAEPIWQVPVLCCLLAERHMGPERSLTIVRAIAPQRPSRTLPSRLGGVRLARSAPGMAV